MCREGIRISWTRLMGHRSSYNDLTVHWKAEAIYARFLNCLLRRETEISSKEGDVTKGKMTSHFKVLLSFTHKEGGGGVYYKHDGERFSQPHTLKLNQNTDYTVAVQSPLILRWVFLTRWKTLLAYLCSLEITPHLFLYIALADRYISRLNFYQFIV